MWQTPISISTPSLQGYPPLSSKIFGTPPPSDSIFGRSYPSFNKGGGGVPTMLHKHRNIDTISKHRQRLRRNSFAR